MNVRRPAAVFLWRTDPREWLAATKTLAHLEATQHVFGKVPVKREEFLAAVGFMPQNHDWSIVQRSGIVRDAVDHPIQRCAKRCAGLNKKVQAKRSEEHTSELQ